MLLGTHAGLPLILLAWRRVRARKCGKEIIPTPYLIVTAIVGALPDLLNPHISLESRLSSWSHGLPFFALFTVLLYVAVIPKRSVITWRWATFWALSYGAHLFCDAISGGIAWKYPFGDEFGAMHGSHRVRCGLPLISFSSSATTFCCGLCR